MEQFLLRFLPTTPRYPVWLRYLVTLFLVALALGAKVLLDGFLSVAPLLLFIPVVFAAAVIFDRGSGFLATFASAAAGGISMPVSWPTLVALVIFILTGLMIATVTETLRKTIERLTDAKAYSDVLLRELAHRTRNDLATIMSILRLQIHGASEPAAQAALNSAISRIEVITKVHDSLQDSAEDQKVHLAPYLEGLCASLADVHRGVRPISINLHCDDAISLKSSEAANVGLIVNELVTNAFKYAFPENRAGSIEVRLESIGQHIAMTVTDDGVGCPAETTTGLGTRLIQLLAARMNGTMTRVALPQGCQVQLLLACES